MNTTRRTESQSSTHQRDMFVRGLQVAAGLMFAQQIGGKAVRDGLFLQYHGPRALPGMIAASAAFSVALSLLSGRVMRSVTPRSFTLWALALSGVLQVLEGWLLLVTPEMASVMIYLHMAGLGAVLLSTFWSMLNEEFDPREAKLRFGQIAAGGTIGGFLGGLAAERTIVWSGPPALMLGLAGLHLVCGGFLAMVMRGACSTTVPLAVAAKEQGRLSPHRSGLLRSLGAIVLLGSIGAALLDYVFKVNATDELGRGTDLLRFFAIYHTGTAVVSFALQYGASRIALEKLGLGKTILALPATLAGGSFVALVAPGALAAGLARGAEAVVRGSLFRAGYETCYTPVPASEKRSAKTLIDVGAERGGDALGAAIVWVCLVLAGAAAVPWMLCIAALIGMASLILCRTLDRIYIEALAMSLESRAVQLPADADMDLTTRSLLLPARFARPGTPAGWKPPLAQTPSAESDSGSQDPVLHRLCQLRSSDARQVHAALLGHDISDRLVAAQICMLIGKDEHASLAHSALLPAAERVLGLLTDFLLDTTLDLNIRRRIARVIGSTPGQRSVDALLLGLEDPRFEVRMQCAHSLCKASSTGPRPVLPRESIMAAVDRELVVGKVLWESHRRQHVEPGEVGTEWLDDLLLEKAHGSLEYIFTLLSLIHDRTPLMTAFRSLHLEDRHLRGTALEYLEGILPAKTREMLWEILQERPLQFSDRGKAEVMEELLKCSETVVLRLQRERPAD